MESRSYRFCLVEDLKRVKSLSRWVDELKDELAAIYLENEIYVISSVCPHFGGEFDFQKRRKCTLKCKWHDWEFDLATGKCLTYSIGTKLRHYKFDVSDGYIMVRYS